MAMGGVCSVARHVPPWHVESPLQSQRTFQSLKDLLLSYVSLGGPFPASLARFRPKSSVISPLRTL